MKRPFTLSLMVILVSAGLAGQLTALAQDPTSRWPHLTPHGFGLEVIGGKLEHAPWTYTPRGISGAQSHLQTPFFSVTRRGERVDIYVPENIGQEERLPCVILFYGGGWGGKYTGGLREITQDLVARGYVVAMPDYVLQAQEPVPTAIWDGAHAIRWLRANASRYHIDPTRIGVWGFSAGGWLVQYLTPSTSSTLYSVTPKNRERRNETIFVPMLDPHPELAEQPLGVQAVVSDWGCGKYNDARVTDLGGDWLNASDPPVFTCHNVRGETPVGAQAYRSAGGPIELCHLETKSTHVPKGITPGLDAGGKPTTWHAAVYDFLDRHLKHPQQATAPEATPAGGPIPSPTKVALRSVYADAAIRFTLDGSHPSEKSPIYRQPVLVTPGQTLQAAVFRRGLKSSNTASFTFRKSDVEPPVILQSQQEYIAKVGQRFEAQLQAKGEDITWSVVGRRGHVINRQSKSPSEPWLSIDAKSGVLSGTPTGPGYNVVIVTARRGQGIVPLVDARQIVVVVERTEQAKD